MDGQTRTTDATASVPTFLDLEFTRSRPEPDIILCCSDSKKLLLHKLLLSNGSRYFHQVLDQFDTLDLPPRQSDLLRGPSSSTTTTDDLDAEVGVKSLVQRAERDQVARLDEIQMDEDSDTVIGLALVWYGTLPDHQLKPTKVALILSILQASQKYQSPLTLKIYLDMLLDSLDSFHDRGQKIRGPFCLAHSLGRRDGGGGSRRGGGVQGAQRLLDSKASLLSPLSKRGSSCSSPKVPSPLRFESRREAIHPCLDSPNSITPPPPRRRRDKSDSVSFSPHPFSDKPKRRRGWVTVKEGDWQSQGKDESDGQGSPHYFSSTISTEVYLEIYSTLSNLELESEARWVLPMFAKQVRLDMITQEMAVKMGPMGLITLHREMACSLFCDPPRSQEDEIEVEEEEEGGRGGLLSRNSTRMYTCDEEHPFR
ncbi:hypothetical protein IE53DRAFT_384608 [Violaceomyces palustris]|uniref:Uncharacterized protein n=1 Tax=Violaceomyces palustris TaxID=1673888 RepID=A0ACD0P478_9BASI|nr:hypothetical protein IE53DRAFT_384608 [Violaceomyces palustris]